MTTGMLWAALLLGLVVQGVVIYGAIRFALVHDRGQQAQAAKKAASAAAWRARAALRPSPKAPSPAGARGTSDPAESRHV